MRKAGRSRAISIASIILAAILGLGSRRFAAFLPGPVVAYTGDAMWALAVFLGLGFVFPALSTHWVALLDALISTLVEVSQLYRAPWIDAIRSTSIGHLALGSDFDPKDLVCYAVGIGIGVLIETVKRPERKRSFR
jgi:hypothetical protein